MEGRTDNFLIATSNLRSTHLAIPITGMGIPVDHFALDVIDGEETRRFQYHKQYGADVLMKIEETLNKK